VIVFSLHHSAPAVRLWARLAARANCYSNFIVRAAHTANSALAFSTARSQTSYFLSYSNKRPGWGRPAAELRWVGSSEARGRFLTREFSRAEGASL
jgi:hypothetical protein